MSFIEKQVHGKHYYYYLAKSVRVSPVKVKKIRVFLGRKIPAHDELQLRFVELEEKTPKHYKTKWLSKETEDRLEDLHTSATEFKNSEGESGDFLVRFTYNTNAIEGNPLTLRQTALILSEGISPEGVKTNSVIEVLNGKDAWDFIKKYKGSINKSFVCKVQYEVTKNTLCRIQGDYRNSEVRIGGSEWNPPKASEMPNLMKKLFIDYKTQKRLLHPLELASWLHNRLVQIHPFTDGNGRTSRLIMNWILMRNKFPPAIIETRNKEKYYNAIEEADKNNQKPFADFLARELLEQYTILEKKS
jgi:Fic family protein